MPETTKTDAVASDAEASSTARELNRVYEMQRNLTYGINAIEIEYRDVLIRRRSLYDRQFELRQETKRLQRAHDRRP